MSTWHTPLIASVLLISSYVRVSLAQPARCRTDRATETGYTGVCLRGTDTVATLTLRAPAARSTLWRGVAYLRWRGQEEPVAVDLRPGGTFRTGTQWFAVLDAQRQSQGAHFKFDPARRAAAGAVDLRILTLARSFVADSTLWNPADDRDAASEPSKGFHCPKTSRRTLFCALYDASVRVAGEYWHGRPAVNAVRSAIAATSAARLQHPLTDFNNAPTTNLRAVQAVFDRAIADVRGELRARGA